MNYEGCNLIGQALSLFLKGHQFESHKSQATEGLHGR